MSKKFSAQRKRAFLTYLSQCGNQTLSAERAKVSRSWVQLHRSGDAEFDAACRAAIEEARVRLEGLALAASDPAAPSPQPLSRTGRGAKWNYLDGHELVVRGTGGSGGGKRVQIGRAREKQWTPRVEKRFLSALASTCNVKAACAEVGLGVTSAYNHRHRRPLFARAWDKAEEIGFLRLEAGLIAAACGMGEEPKFEPDLPIEGMTVWHAMQLFFMHRHQVRGTGGRPGAPAASPLASDAEMVKHLTRSLRQFGVTEEQLAAIGAREQPR